MPCSAQCDRTDQSRVRAARTRSASDARSLVERADDHSAGKAHHHLAQRAMDRRQSEPRFRRQIVRFGVARRVGQMLVDVMLEMNAAIEAVGQPQIERRRRDQGVEPGPACRIAVDRLMLQRALQADDRRTQRQHQPPGQIVIEPREAGERAIDAGRQRQRRPIDADPRDDAGGIGRRARPGIGDQLRQMQRDRVRLGLQPALVLDGLLGPVKHRASFRQSKGSAGTMVVWESVHGAAAPQSRPARRPAKAGRETRHAGIG